MNLTLQTIPSTLISELLINSNFDGIVLDTEHGVFNEETLYSCIQIITLSKKVCYVRVTNLDKKLVRMCLDAGCDGIIFSTVNSKEQAEKILKYCHYPNNGGVRGCGLVRENKWGKESLSIKKPKIIAQIETKNSVDNLNDIINCGFDFYIVGPYDLSNSLGKPAEWENDLYKKYIKKVFNNIPKNKLGVFLVTMSDIKDFINSNTDKPKILISGMDAIYIKECSEKIVEMVNL